MPDQYWSQLGLGKAAKIDNGLNVGPNDVGAASSAPGGGNSGQSTQGASGSPDQAGTGFVNLTHLLQLNGQSGQNSAQQYAKQTSSQISNAKAGINSAQDNFNQQVKAGTTDANQVENDPGGAGPGVQDGQDPRFANNKNGGYYQSALDRANAGYTGPQGDLSGQGGYDKLTNQIGAAQSRGQNSQSAAGVAAQVGQDTGLSAKQSAASAFYMGLSNPDIRKSGANYTQLGKMLNDANARAQNTANMGKQTTYNAQTQLTGDVNDANNYWGQIDKNAQQQQAQNDLRTNTQNIQNQAQQTANHARYGGKNDGTYGSQYGNVANGLGGDSNTQSGPQGSVPGDLWQSGMSYQDWVNYGEPGSLADAKKKGWGGR